MKKNKEPQQVNIMCGPILDTTLVKIKIAMTDSSGIINKFQHVLHIIINNSIV